MLTKLRKNILDKETQEIILAGSIVWLSPDKFNIPAFQARGVLEDLDPIPLKSLRGWNKRAEFFEKAGITTAQQLFAANPDSLAKKTGEDPRRINLWKATLLRTWRKF